MLQIVVTALVVLLDQLSKYMLEPFLLSMPGHQFMLIDNVFSLTLMHNSGIAFGLFDSSPVFMTILISVIVAAVIAVMVKTRDFKSKLYKISISLVLGGAIGNLIDRFVQSYVIDIFKFEFIDFPVFNLADSCITVGAVLLLVYLLFFYKKEPSLNIDKAKDVKADE